ncbi:5867_t:CDS:2, partial [Entrophospora sp. SA101]
TKEVRPKVNLEYNQRVCAKSAPTSKFISDQQVQYRYCFLGKGLYLQNSDYGRKDLNEELSLHNHVKRVLEVIVDLLIDKLGMVKPLIKK